MRKYLAMLLLIVPLPALAQSNTAVENALKDSARYQRDQAYSLRQMERTQREQARRDDSFRQNAERDSRSMRRFDR